jgi:hypothetical protein
MQSLVGDGAFFVEGNLSGIEISASANLHVGPQALYGSLYA